MKIKFLIRKLNTLVFFLNLFFHYSRDKNRMQECNVPSHEITTASV